MNTFQLRDNVRYYNLRFSEMPIGDPLSGAAYGEYLKSKALGAIIGVVAAVAAVATGGATLMAYAAGTAGVSLGSALAAGAMVAGGVMSGVGAVTGNKKLMKIGGVLALAGGLGAMVTGGLGNVGNVAAASGSEVAPAATAIGEGSASTAAETLVGKLGGGTAAEAFGPSTGMNGGILDVSSSASTSVGDIGSGLQAAQNAPAAASFQAPSSGIVDQALGNAPAGGVSAPLNEVPAVAGAPGAAPAPSSGGFLDNVTGFMKDNKTLVEMGGKVLGGLGDSAMRKDAAAQAASDGTASDTTTAKSNLYDAQASSANAQAEATRAKTAAEQQQIANANAQIVMISSSDPNRDAKVADAVAKGVRYQIMEQFAAKPVTMGAQNYAPTANNWAPQR